jgi:N-acyl-phosphatidylethanolamine-hydrolysing phospholipase D
MAVLFGAIPLVYYSYVEIIRTKEVRKRRKRYHKFINTVNDSSISVITAEHRDEIRIAFASFRVGKRWSNPFPEWRESGAWEFIFWHLIYQPLTGRIGWNGGWKDATELSERLELEEMDFALLSGEFEDKNEVDLVRREGDETAQERRRRMTFTWIGQSTSYIQLDGVAFLTDPVFSHKTIDSIFAPPRLRPPPCSLSDLPYVDVVLVSHSHFDHLHPDVVLELGDMVKYFVPLGLASYFHKLGVTNVIEMDWWDSEEISLPSRYQGGGDEKFTITAVPAMHWTARSALDINQSQWCSFIVQGRSQSFAHIGDTGYSSDLFKAIGNYTGGVDLALIPIGAYLPRWRQFWHSLSYINIAN